MADRTLANISIEDIMVKDVKYVTNSTTIGEAVKAFSKYRVGGFPVVDEEKRVVAYLSDGDIIHYIRMKASWHALQEMSVLLIMTIICVRSHSLWTARSLKTCRLKKTESSLGLSVAIH